LYLRLYCTRSCVHGGQCRFRREHVQQMPLPTSTSDASESHMTERPLQASSSGCVRNHASNHNGNEFAILFKIEVRQCNRSVLRKSAHNHSGSCRAIATTARPLRALLTGAWCTAPLPQAAWQGSHASTWQEHGLLKSRQPRQPASSNESRYTSASQTIPVSQN
jgi:hypothetical protein